MEPRAALGRLTVFLSTAAALWSDLLYPNYDLLPWWNAVFRFAAFLSVAVLLATLRRIIESQWDHLEREAAVTSGLRELNEVKDTLLHAVSHDPGTARRDPGFRADAPPSRADRAHG